MPRIIEEQGSSSGPISQQEQHGVLDGRQVGAVESMPNTRRNISKCQDPESRELLRLDELCLTDVAEIWSQEARTYEVENGSAPLVASPVQQSPLAAIPALAVMLHIVKLIKRRTTEQGPMHSPAQSAPDLAPCHARAKTAMSTEPSSGNRRRRKRTKGKKSRAAAAKRTAWRLDTAKLLEEGADSMKIVKHVESVAEEEKATRQDQVRAERSSGRQEEEGRLERTRAGCQDRANTEPKHTFCLEKEPAEAQPQGGTVTKGPERVQVAEDLVDASPAIAAAIALDLPSPRESKRARDSACALEGGVRLPLQVMQRLWAWIAYERIIGRVGGGGGDEVSRPGRGLFAAASQEEGCAKEPAVIEVAKEAADASSTIGAAIPLDLPSPRETKRAEEDAAAEESETKQDGETSGVLIESEEGSTACRLLNAVELLSPAESRISKPSGTSAAYENMSLELPFPRETTRMEKDAATMGCGEAEDGELSRVPNESEEGSTACQSKAVELLSPAESSIGNTFGTLAACVVRYPMDLEEELRARIADRGGGEVVVEAVAGGAVEVVSGQGRGPPEQGQEVLVPRMCQLRKRPGDLKNIFVRNLRKDKENGAHKGAGAVSAAKTALLEDPCGGPRQLEEVDVLGEGGFGTVSAVRHAVFPGEFALKTLREGANQRAQYSAVVEMTVLARLSLAPHDNVVAPVALDDTQLATMPILLPKAECDFLTVLKNGGWATSELLRCVGQVASGAEHMHGHGIGHGDIKPENVLMFEGKKNGEMVPKLADFGTSRELGELRPKMMGTMGYMPLECMLGQVETSPSQDVWALAVMSLVICAASGKAQSNMFAHTDLYTDKERAARNFLQARGSPSEIAHKLRRFECTVTTRALEDGSYMNMLEKEKLNPDLGLAGRESVSDYLPYFLAKTPEIRCDIKVFQTVVANIANEVAEHEAEMEAYWSQSSELLDNEDGSEDYDDPRRVCR